MPAASSSPSPQSSTPQLLDTTDRSLTPVACRARMSSIGLPHSPKPPTARVAPGGMSSTAVAASGYTLLTMCAPFPEQRVCVGGDRLGAGLPQRDRVMVDPAHIDDLDAETLPQAAGLGWGIQPGLVVEQSPGRAQELAECIQVVQRLH